MVWPNDDRPNSKLSFLLVQTLFMIAADCIHRKWILFGTNGYPLLSSKPVRLTLFWPKCMVQKYLDQKYMKVTFPSVQKYSDINNLRFKKNRKIPHLSVQNYSDIISTLRSPKIWKLHRLYSKYPKIFPSLQSRNNQIAFTFSSGSKTVNFLTVYPYICFFKTNKFNFSLARISWSKNIWTKNICKLPFLSHDPFDQKVFAKFLYHLSKVSWQLPFLLSFQKYLYLDRFLQV